MFVRVETRRIPSASVEAAAAPLWALASATPTCSGASETLTALY